MSLVDLGKKLLEYAKRGETDRVRLLMSNGAPFTTDWLGTSALHMAAQHGHVKTAEILLRAGISKDARTKVDRTPLHVAAQEGHADIVEMLLMHGAEIDAKDMLQMTPLHWAVERGHIPVINCLLSHDSDPNACTKFNKTPLDIAEDNCRADIMHILLEHSAFLRMNLPVRMKDGPIRHSAKGQRMILPKPQAPLPTDIVRKVSLTDVKDLVSRAIVTKKEDVNSNSISEPGNSSSCASARIVKSTHPVKFHSNTLSDASSEVIGNRRLSSDNSEYVDDADQCCTNVLATLAALAEATAPNASISTQEAVQWLELHGITMLPSDNSTMVATALEGGQSVSLTEAGKLALTWDKEPTHLSENGSAIESAVPKVSSAAISTNKEHSAFSRMNPLIGMRNVKIRLAKGQAVLLPKPMGSLPSDTVRKVSVTDIKNFVSRTVVTKKEDVNSNVISEPGNSSSCASARIVKSTQPVKFHSNKLMDASSQVIESPRLSSDDFEYAISTQEAVQLLELHGIKLLSSDNSTIVGNALEGGQSVSLTEAGKLALTWVKEHKDSSQNSSPTESAALQKVSRTAISPTKKIDQKCKTVKQYVAFVTEKSRMPSIISSTKAPIVLVDGQARNLGDSQPVVKKIKIHEDQADANAKSPSIVEKDDPQLLRRKLEKAMKEAQEAKAQFILKQHEVEKYKKQLDVFKKA